MRVVRFIVRNWPLKVGAVLLAAILYTAMVVLQNTAAWPGSVAIDLVNQPADGYLIDAKSIPAVDGIRYFAPPDVPVSQSSFRATADLSGVKPSESDSPPIRVTLKADDSRIQIIDYKPQQIFVRLDPLIHKQVGVKVFETNLPSGLQPGTPVLGVATVEVSGAATYVRRVAYAQAAVRIDASGLDVDEEVDLVARDATDLKVDNVTFNPTTVHVQIQVGSQLRTETVPVNAARSIVGAPAAGYNITSIEVKPSIVSVQGQADALALLKGKANTKAVSISGATQDMTVNVGLDLPNGVTSDTASVSITIHLASPTASRSVSVGVVPAGARSDRIYTLSTPSVIVTLSGAAAALNAFDSSTLVGTVSVGSLDAGTHTVNITVVVPAGINAGPISPAQITVTVASAPTPPPSASPVPS